MEIPYPNQMPDCILCISARTEGIEILRKKSVVFPENQPGQKLQNRIFRLRIDIDGPFLLRSEFADDSPFRKRERLAGLNFSCRRKISLLPDKGRKLLGKSGVSDERLFVFEKSFPGFLIAKP